ncbi:tape measure protein [Methylobacter sp. Wu1]|uniref:tape measure protein n=1 Tax=Methylobacter sp. Wu1 TaxID=3119359 RepID=UPI002F93C0C1
MSNLDLRIILRLVDQATAPLRRVYAAVGSIGAPLRSVAREAGAMSLKIAGLATASGFAFKKLFIDVTAEFENLSVALEATEGSAEKGKKALAWITEFAKKTPLELETTTKAYMLLKNAGINPMNGSLMALVDANAKVSGSQDDMIEKTRQLGQAWMKGKLQQEEINVLTERGVAVVPLLAKALGKTDAAVLELAGKGKIGRKEIALLFEAMGKDANGAAEKQSRTWTGMTSTLSDTWQGFVRDVMTKGQAFNFLKDRLQKIIDTLNYLTTPEGMKQTQVYADQLSKTLEAIEHGAKAAWAELEELKDMVGSWGNLIKVVLGGITAIMAGPLLMAVTTLIATFVASPILLILTAIAGVVLLIVRNWDTLVAKVKSSIDDMLALFKRWGDYLVDVIGGAISGVIDGILGIGRAIRNLAQLKNPFAGGEALFPMPPAPRPTVKTPAPSTPVNNLLQFKAPAPRMPLLSLDAQPESGPVKRSFGPATAATAPAGEKPRSVLDFKAPSFGQAKAAPADRPANAQPKGKTLLDFKAPSFGPAKAAPAQAAEDKPKVPSILDYPMPTLSAQGKPAPTLSTIYKFDAGGELTIKIDQEGRRRVGDMKTNDRRMTYNVDAGLIMPGAR